MTCRNALRVAAFVLARGLLAQDSAQDVRWTPEHFAVNLSVPTLVEVPAIPSAGFSFPYYLYIPKDLPRNAPVRLLVEPNNTGRTTDDLEMHRQGAKRLVSERYRRLIADRLQAPLLVPVFPRPRTEWKLYTHSLDRDSLLVKDGPVLRIDLQLLAMIKHARGMLNGVGVRTKPRVFMHGFSASAAFVNRFAALHPKAVRAIAAGALNALPLLPLEKYEGVMLPFPLGVGDLKSLTNEKFEVKAYRKVSQYLYMGYLDRNDTFPYGDAWDDGERAIISKVFGKEMMPDRWERVQRILASLRAPIQTVTYNGVAHATRPEMWDDVVAFFKANDGDKPARIVPHQYPFVPFRRLENAHVTGLYWKGAPGVPEHLSSVSERFTFIIAIKEWMEGQDYQQLRTFLEDAGFEFELVADQQERISIDRKAFCGTTSYGQGKFQGYYVCLDSAVADRLIPGVKYSLRPANKNKAYTWTVLPDAVLVRPSENVR